MTTKTKTLLWLLLLLILLTTPVYAVDSAQDAEISVSPVIHYFPVTAFGSSSAAGSFLISNHNTSEPLLLGTLSLSGLGADQFSIGTDNCSDTSLPAGSDCSVEVHYTPNRRGTVSANLLIPSSAAQTPTLAAFVSNYEAPVNEAQRRVPPVLSATSIPETLQAGQTELLSWSLEGYHPDYSVVAALFDCTGVPAGSCGDSYDDSNRFAESGVLSNPSISPGQWTYRNLSTQLFTYTWNFPVPAKRADNSDWAAAGTDIVVRFYLRSSIDAARGNTGVSLLIPGNQSATYYDTEGRRIVKKIIP